MKKRTLILASIFALSLSMVACSNSVNENSSTLETVAVADEMNSDVPEESKELKEADAEDTEQTGDEADNKQDNKQDNEQEGNQEDLDSEIILDPIVIIAGEKIEIGEDIAIKVDKLGSFEYEAAPSCLGAGEDKTYIFDSIYIYTRPEGERDNVFSIEADEGTVLPSGLIVGEATIDDIKAIYGDSIEDCGDYFEYNKDGIVIDLDIEDGVLIYAEIYRA